MERVELVPESLCGQTGLLRPRPRIVHPVARAGIFEDLADGTNVSDSKRSKRVDSGLVQTSGDLGADLIDTWIAQRQLR